MNYHYTYYARRKDGSLVPVEDSRRDLGEVVVHVQSARKLNDTPRGVDEAFLRMKPGQVARLVIDPAWGFRKKKIEGLVDTEPLIVDIEVVECS